MSEAQEAQSDRLLLLNKWILDAVVDGKRAHYDRTRVLTSDYTKIDFRDDSATVSIPHRSLLRRQFEQREDDSAVGGTCRELAQWVVVDLLKKGLVDSADVYACATDHEAHYVVVAVIDGRKYLIDIAYSQPVLEAIEVDGQDHESAAYAGEKGSKQAFAGKITYKAVEKEDGSILFSVNAPNRSTEFPLYPLDDELDVRIPGKWARVTDSGYATKVRGNPDGTFRVDIEQMGSAATLQDDFKRLHKIAKASADAVKVVFRHE